ncbi:MAG: lipopolysaccharide heptosyltransferase II, partial [Victivallaceae bacterium]|nr:lipopolysaccharide heptosyltransferase II [Victivallaceae bacterium]
PILLGDAVMALPALAALKTLLPKYCALIVVAPAGQAALYEALPHIVDEKILLQKPHAFWPWETRCELKRFRVGAGILFNNSFRDALMMKCAGIPYLFGYDGRHRRILLQGALPLPKRPRGRAMKIHQANLYYALAEAFGAAPWNGHPVDLVLPPGIELPEKARAVTEGKKLLVIASGAAYGAAKRYGADAYREIARDWLASGGTAAVVGSASERGIAAEVLRGLPTDRTADLCGETTLAQLMKLLKAAQVCVANDSGTMHLAAALRVPGATVFGPTDYTSTAPVGRWSLILSPTDCAPCLRRVCPKKEHLCMRRMPWQCVGEELRRLAEPGPFSDEIGKFRAEK